MLENTHTGKNSWGLVFYIVKSKLLDYYRLRLKYTTSSSILDALGNFISENGIPIIIITDSNGVLSEGNKWKALSQANVYPPPTI